jgi:magnesium chelatase family protein
MYGPPGTGKTMLARALASILPPLSFDEALEVTSIHSVAGLLRDPIITRAPFRSPHHTSSYVSLVGGGTTPKPGEVTLAHRGVLFMDEFPEFSRDVIEALRQPLEDKEVSIARAKATAIFPANFILVAAMNPCPCGNFGSSKQCTCPPGSLARYQRKLSGPIIDRIDLWLNVEAVDHEKLSARTKGESSEKVAERVAAARDRQTKRFAGGKNQPATNSSMRPRDLEKYVKLSDNVTKLLNSSASKLGLSARSYHRVIKLARTIADLDASDDIAEKHLLEALSYRPKKFV